MAILNIITDKLFFQCFEVSNEKCYLGNYWVKWCWKAEYNAFVLVSGNVIIIFKSKKLIMFTTVGLSHLDQAFFSDIKVWWYIKYKNYFQNHIFIFTVKSYFCAHFFPIAKPDQWLSGLIIAVIGLWYTTMCVYRNKCIIVLVIWTLKSR